MPIEYKLKSSSIIFFSGVSNSAINLYKQQYSYTKYQIWRVNKFNYNYAILYFISNSVWPICNVHIIKMARVLAICQLRSSTLCIIMGMKQGRKIVPSQVLFYNIPKFGKEKHQPWFSVYCCIWVLLWFFFLKNKKDQI